MQRRGAQRIRCSARAEGKAAAAAAVGPTPAKSRPGAAKGAEKGAARIPHLQVCVDARGRVGQGHGNQRHELVGVITCGAGAKAWIEEAGQTG